MQMIQLQFINALLSSRDKSLLIVNNINDSFFSDFKNEFNFIKNHLDEYDTVPDKETFLSNFPNFDIVEVNETPDYLVDALYEDRNKRRLAETFNKVKKLLLENKTEEAMTLYTNSAGDMVKAKHLDCIDILKNTTRYDDYLARRDDYQNFYVSTGFKELDEYLGGWDRKEELVTIVARTNVGKSWAALRCAIGGLEQGLNVGMYSGEMSDRKVGYRFDTLVSHISNSSITKGKPEVQNDYKVYIDDLCNRYKGSFKILTPPMIDGQAGVNALRAFIEKENLDMLVVDQHSLLEDDRHARNPYEKASNISRDLKNLQTLEQIPIIAVAQQNRNSTENGVDASHIAQSDRISQDSTIILFFEKKDDIMTMSLVKARDSANFKKFDYRVDFDKGIWEFQPNIENDNGGTQSSIEKVEQFKNEYGDDVFH